MVAIKVDVDDRDFLSRLTDLINRSIPEKRRKAVMDIASDILLVSTEKVPHDTGLLQNSGKVEPLGEDAIVGYNKVYAARLHEHPEYRFQNGRTGKWLENAIKAGQSKYSKYFKDFLQK